MPKRSKKSSGSKGILAVLLVGVLGAGALAAYVKFSPQASHVTTAPPTPSDDSWTRSTPKPKSTDSQTPAVGKLMIPSVVQNDVQLDHDAGTIPADVRPEVFVVNQTLQALKVDGVHALGVDVRNRVAMMDFNPEVQKGYGTMEEGYLIKAMQMALGQFKDIDSFLIIVDGKPVDSLGNIDLSKPVPVLRPGQKDTATNDDPPSP